METVTTKCLYFCMQLSCSFSVEQFHGVNFYFTRCSISICKSSRHSLLPLPFNPVVHVKSLVLKIRGRGHRTWYFLTDKAFEKILPAFEIARLCLFRFVFRVLHLLICSKSEAMDGKCSVGIWDGIQIGCVIHL